MHPETPTPPAAKLAAGLLLNDAEVAELCGLAVNTVRNWRCQGTGPAFVKLGKRAVRYRAEDVRAFMDGTTQRCAA